MSSSPLAATISGYLAARPCGAQCGRCGLTAPVPGDVVAYVCPRCTALLASRPKPPKPEQQQTAGTTGRKCPQCAGPLPARRRLCPACAEKRRKATYRTCRKRHVQAAAQQLAGQADPRRPSARSFAALRPPRTQQTPPWAPWQSGAATVNGHRDDRPVVARDPRPTERQRRLLAAMQDFLAGRVRPQNSPGGDVDPEADHRPSRPEAPSEAHG